SKWCVPIQKWCVPNRRPLDSGQRPGEPRKEVRGCECNVPLQLARLTSARAGGLKWCVPQSKVVCPPASQSGVSPQSAPQSATD
ncbi:MAG: hypothetical protein ACKPHU_07520, partial [Planctomycetaceae bacterium]